MKSKEDAEKLCTYLKTANSIKYNNIFKSIKFAKIKFTFF